MQGVSNGRFSFPNLEMYLQEALGDCGGGGEGSSGGQTRSLQQMERRFEKFCLPPGMLEILRREKQVQATSF